MMGDLSTSIFGQECFASITRDQVQINLPEWSGRQPHKEAYEGLEEMIDFLTEVKDAIANAHPEGSEWLEDESPAVTAPTAIQYEVKTIFGCTDHEIARYLNDGWEIIYQDVNYPDHMGAEIITRFKRPVRSVISTERLTSEASNTPTDFLEEVKSFFVMVDDGAVMPTTAMLYRFAWHLIRTGDTSAVNLFASRYEKYVDMARDSRLAVANG